MEFVGVMIEFPCWASMVSTACIVLYNNKRSAEETLIVTAWLWVHRTINGVRLWFPGASVASGAPEHGRCLVSKWRSTLKRRTWRHQHDNWSSFWVTGVERCAVRSKSAVWIRSPHWTWSLNISMSGVGAQGGPCTATIFNLLCVPICFISPVIPYSKKKSRPATRHVCAWGERRYSSYSFTISALDGGEWSASRPGRAFTPRERTRGTHCTGGWVGPRAGLDTG
jgi:hypothetical protein